MTILKTKRKQLLILTLLLLLVLTFSVLFLQRNAVKTDSQRLLNELNRITSQSTEIYPENVEYLDKNTTSPAILAIEKGASYGQEISSGKIIITQAVYKNARLENYLSIQDDLTSTFAPVSLLVTISLLFYALTAASIYKQGKSEENCRQQKMTTSQLADEQSSDSFNHFICFFQFPLIIFNKKGEIKASNAAFQERFGDYKQISEFSKNIDFSNFLMRQILQEKAAEKKMYFEDLNQYFHVEFVLLNQQSADRDYMLSMRDITESHKIVDSQKELIANISHELKTPLTSIHGFAEILRTSDLSKEEHENFSSLISSESDRLLELVADILLLTQTHRKIEKEKLQASQLIHQILKNLQTRVSEKELDIELDLTDAEFSTNQKMLYVILKNLIENAVFYSERKEKVKMTLQVDDEKGLNFKISNRALGLTEIEKERLFERFFRGKSAGKHNQQGTGLGLSLVKKNLEELAASVSFKSEADETVSFEVNIPK